MARMAVWALLLLLAAAWTWSGVEAQGYWDVVVPNAGIASMHSAVTHYGSVVLLDRTNIGPSQLPLPPGECRNNPLDRVSTHDCTAHSALYTPGPNSIRPLFIFTDTWCSSGSFDANGVLVQTGGDSDGNLKIRTFTPCDDGDCDWIETTTPLQQGRWYSSNQRLPDGTQIVVGGRGSTTAEFVPDNGRGLITISMLGTTNDAQNDNLYPYVHLLPNNLLFIFANVDSILFNWRTYTVEANLPALPGNPRNYPSAGSSVMLPLNNANGFTYCEIVVCGGAQYGAFLNNDNTEPAVDTCGRIAPLSANPAWEIEYMPHNRLMGDMILLPTENVLIIDGAGEGSQGWGMARDAVTTPDLYMPYNAAGTRFTSLTGTTIPRVYHSTANMISDGSIILAGSNTNEFYTFTGVLFPTELRIERFVPDYIQDGGPEIIGGPATLGYGADFAVTMTANNPTTVLMQLYAPPYNTHSFSQGQRLLVLSVKFAANGVAGQYTVNSVAPPSNVIAPAGYYMLFPVVDGVVGYCWWIQLVN